MGVLTAEMLLCSFIVLPMPSKWRRNVLESFAKVWNTHVRFRFGIKIIMIAIAGFVADAVWGIYRAYLVTDLPHEAEAVGGPGKQITMRLYEAERNLIMGLFILFLLMMIYRFQSMIHQAVLLSSELEISTEKIEKQNEEHARLKKERGTWDTTPVDSNAEVGVSSL